MAERFIGSLFKALGEAVVMGVTAGIQAKVEKELGVKEYDPYSSRQRDMEEFVERARIQARREARKVIRMEKIMKNLRTRPKIGYTY